ncbi:MAG: phosphoglycerate dehydrogenase [Deltaproteobacteria bacterium]|nr:phosphoglycerate dehydrogenase [Deltaproteobacteria bacterium]
MKILIADKFPEAHANTLRDQGHQLLIDASLADASLAAALPGYEVLIVRSTKVSAAAIDSGDALRLIIRAGSGYNTIDTAHAASRGVAVANTPGMNAIAVAELAMGLLLAVDRQIPDNVIASRAGVWDKARFGKADGLYGRTLGLVGAGQIGAELTVRARAFGMRVLIYDPYLSPAKVAALGAEQVAELHEIASRSDAVSVHVPKTASTTHLIDGAFLEAMREGAILLHTSRGGVVDDAALLAALDSRRLRAGLDVFEDEPAASKGEFPSALAQHPRVVATHHIGASTSQAQDAVADEVMVIIEALASRDEVIHRVN